MALPSWNPNARNTSNHLPVSTTTQYNVVRLEVIETFYFLSYCYCSLVNSSEAFLLLYWFPNFRSSINDRMVARNLRMMRNRNKPHTQQQHTGNRIHLQARTRYTNIVAVLRVRSFDFCFFHANIKINKWHEELKNIQTSCVWMWKRQITFHKVVRQKKNNIISWLLGCWTAY